MDAQFWRQCWQRGRIGFHQPKVLPLLPKHWPSLALGGNGRVLVPLCGKSLDMHWLAAQGHDVLGIELSTLAVEQFFIEAGLQPERYRSALGEHYCAGRIEIIQGDAFALRREDLADIVGIYDRAALVALPPAMRAGYITAIYDQLRAGCRGLLITLEYDQQQMDGPPFSVPQLEVESQLAACAPTLRERRDLLAHQPQFAERGLSAFDTAVYTLTRIGPT